jgi:hypothetical protein
VILLGSPDRSIVDAVIEQKLAGRARSLWSQFEILDCPTREDEEHNRQPDAIRPGVVRQIVEELKPHVMVIVFAADLEGAHLVYVARTVTRSFYPDILFAHNLAPCGLTDSPRPDDRLPWIVDPGACAMIDPLIDLMPPHRLIVGCIRRANGTQVAIDLGELAQAAVAARAVARREQRRRQVSDTRKLTTWLRDSARVLRLTVSQQARLAEIARSALIRGVTLPALPDRAVRTKTEGKRGLGELIDCLEAVRPGGNLTPSSGRSPR